VKREKTGLTMIELLIVLGIIALLVGLLIPALSTVRNIAKETKQKAQFATIEMALATFKNDYGDYPESNASINYCGSQKLTEALFGWDLLGFHPKSAWRADGLDALDGPGTYDPDQTRDVNGDGIPDTLNERKGPYLELAATDVFMLGHIREHGGLFSDSDSRFLSKEYFIKRYSLDPDRYMICDSFGTKSVLLPNGKLIKAGSPILYYKSNTSSKICDPQRPQISLYNILDNQLLVNIGSVKDRKIHPLSNTNVFYSYKYGILDPKITARAWPHRPDSYILISAGADGLYGTGDDITNFGN
jgi:type II secretory pathway pseudopilin PulG